MKFRAIPQPNATQTDINRAVKENFETLVGLRTGKVAPLDSAATTADIIAKINELIAKVQQG